MRKIFCDGCNEELRESFSKAFRILPGEIYFTGLYCETGAEILWCKACTRVAETAVKDAQRV